MDEKGYAFVPGLTCPHCGANLDPDERASQVRRIPAHGAIGRHTDPVEGCGGTARVSITPDGIALLTPEQWERAHGANR